MIEILLLNCTHLSLSEIKEIMTAENPRDAKVRLAEEIVTLYHSKEEAEKAKQYFINTFSKKNIPEDVQEIKIDKGSKLIDMMAGFGLADSKGDARRKIEQGAVSLNQEKIIDVDTLLDERFDNQVIRVGKKDFVRVIFE